MLCKLPQTVLPMHCNPELWHSVELLQSGLFFGPQIDLLVFPKWGWYFCDAYKNLKKINMLFFIFRPMEFGHHIRVTLPISSTGQKWKVHYLSSRVVILTLSKHHLLVHSHNVSEKEQSLAVSFCSYFWRIKGSDFQHQFQNPL